MITKVFTAILLASLPVVSSAAETGPAADWIEHSRQLALQLGSELKGELGKAMAAGGPVAAIDVCRTPCAGHRRAPVQRIGRDGGAHGVARAQSGERAGRTATHAARAVQQRAGVGQVHAAARGSVRNPARRPGGATLHARHPDRARVPDLPRQDPGTGTRGGHRARLSQTTRRPASSRASCAARSP